MKYTGRVIAIITDIHALIEPLEAIMNDINKRGIKEIYSLGDNIGTGPCPKETMSLLRKNKVKSVAGNAEYYLTLGVGPFMSYFTEKKIESNEWTRNKLTKKDLLEIEKYPASIELTIGKKKVALCHFANDVRIDYTIRSTWTYQDERKYGNKGYLQFEYTNSDEQKKDILKNMKIDKPFYNGFRKAYEDPLFGGKKVNEFDVIFQGHVHFKHFEESPTTKFYTVGMAYFKKNIATYSIIREKEIGFDYEEVFVNFNRDKMLDSIAKSDIPNKFLIEKYIRH